MCALANLNLRWHPILQIILPNMAVLLVGEANPNLAQNLFHLCGLWS